MKRSIITILAIAVLSTSCLKLDFYPHNALSRYDIGEDDIELMWYGLYNCSQYKPGTDGYYYCDIIGGDVVRVGGSSAGLTPQLMIKDLVHPGSGFVNSPWTNYYAWLYQVNCFIASAEKLGSGPDVDRYLGTGYFFRGLIYYNLVTKWREVPVLREPTNDPVAKSSESDCWAFVEENLKDAVSLLGDYGGDNTYLSRQAAQALLARTYLAEGKYKEAAETAEAVITSGYFALDTYKNIWNETSNREVIFAYANISADENGVIMSNVFRGAPTYVPTTDFESQVTTSDERYPFLAYADGQYVTANKYNTYGGYDPIVIARLSEMYLISAEGRGRTDGLSRLNDLRTFRGLSAYDGFSSDEAFLDAILAERRVELIQEGFRWFDLVRTGKYTSTLGLGEQYCVLPVPETQIERSKGVLVQNPLWVVSNEQNQ